MTATKTRSTPIQRHSVAMMTALSLTLSGLAPSVVADDSAQAMPELPSAEERVAILFEIHDGNGDGRITEDEFRAKAEGHFADWDTNQDGFLSLDEVPEDLPKPALISPMRKVKRQMRRARARAQGADLEMHEGPTRMKLFARLDRDGDELLSEEEFFAPSARMFTVLDESGDGEIIEEEAFAVAEAMEARLAAFAKRIKKRRARRSGGEG